MNLMGKTMTMKSALLMILAASLMGGCLEEQPARNTVQHGTIAKEDLLGTDGKAVWYYLQTVTDVPYATGFTFAGEQSLLEKVRWDIQEKVLYARRAYEWVRNSDAASSSPEQGDDPKKVIGAPIAAFAIEKHFDIIREYNSATGEEINKIVENDQDRHWYQRKFMRVDWSKNLISNFEFLVHYDDDGVNPLRQEALPYYVSDPLDPDALRIRRPEATTASPRPTADYLEVTSRLMVTPEQVTESYSDGDWRMPACWMAEDYGPEFASTDCAAQEIKLRHSFMKGSTRDYDSLVYDDLWMERFGYFTTERQSYDKQYAETETGRVRLANRFNIWNKSLSATACDLKAHYKSSTSWRASYAAARKAADAACTTKEGEGSRCSLMQNKCTLGWSKRGGVRQIAYYLNVGFPEELKAKARGTVASWNDAFTTTAARLLYPSDNQQDAALLAKRKAEIGDIFVLKDNGCSEANVNAFVQQYPQHAQRVKESSGVSGPPFALSDGKALVRACSALEQATANGPAVGRFTWQRIGDLRYTMFYWVGVPTRAALLGYGPSSIEPETGEILQANFFVYGAVHDLYSARATDIVGLLNCKDAACIQAFAKGVPISDWVALAKSATTPKARTFSQAQIGQMTQKMQLGWLKSATAKLPPLDFSTLESLRKSIRARSTALANSKVLGQNGATAAARLKAISGTTLEALARNQFMQGIGRSGTSAPGATASKLSFYHWAGPGMLRERHKAKLHMAKRTVELAEFFDNLILGLALRYKETGKTRDQIFADLRARLFAGVADHEMGHTLGLRHNFAATYDALNYHPSYWKLRQLEATGQALPRYKKAFSKVELQGKAKDPAANEGLGSYQYASVMDYPGKLNGDIHGIGYYDRAAIKFAYGQLVEVFNNVSSSAQDRYLLANVQTSIRWGEPLLFTVSCDGKDYRSVHYTEYPRLVGGAQNLARANRADVPLSKMTTKKLSKAAPGCKVYTWGALWDSDVPVDDKGRFEVPFRFCSDEFESSSPECSAYDAGADIYEQTQTIIDTYKYYYLFNNLKLDRLGFSLWGYMDTIDYRYLEPLRASMQFYLLMRGDLTWDPRNGSFLGETDTKKFFEADNGYGPWTVAVDRSLNFLLGILATPEVGNYWLGNDLIYDQVPYYSTATGKELPPDLSLSIPSGKYMASSWDFDSGYYWYDKMSHVGVFHDKFLALWALTNAETWFLGRDTSSDLRQYSINYFRLYPDLITRQMRGIFTEDWSITGHLAANKALIERDFTLSTTPPAKSYPVNPQIGYTIQFFAALLGLSQIPSTFDTSFIDSCRIWVKGAQDAIIPNTLPVCFADTFSGKSYCAVSKKDTKGVETGIGAAMIAKAVALQARYAKTAKPRHKLALQQFIDSLDLMRAISHTYSYTPF